MPPTHRTIFIHSHAPTQISMDTFFSKPLPKKLNMILSLAVLSSTLLRARIILLNSRNA